MKNLESNSQKLFTGASLKVNCELKSVDGQTEKWRLNLGALIRKDRNLMVKVCIRQERGRGDSRKGTCCTIGRLFTDLK